MAAKPIFIVKIPSSYSRENGKSIREHFDADELGLKKDYHIMMVDGQPVEELTFECYNVSDVDEIKFEEFKKIINKANK